MILVRLVFQAKFGKATDVVAGFKQTAEIAGQVVGQDARGRILTDLSGPFDTAEKEIAVESLAEWKRLRAALCQATRNLGTRIASRENRLFRISRADIMTVTPELRPAGGAT